MNLIMIICIIIIVLVLLLIWITLVYNNYQNLKLKITAAENDINTLVRNEFDILNNVSSIINEKFKEEPFKELNTLKEKKLSNFEINRQLKEYIGEFYKLKTTYQKEFKENEDLNKFSEKLDETEEFIRGCQEYYNDTVIKYNKSISTFPNILIAKLTKQQEKKLYDKIKENLKL